MLLLASCGGAKGKFRIKGEFKNMDLGEFYIFSPDGGLNGMDTLHLIQGRFRYQCDLTGDATYHILYPNFREIVVWGHDGDVIDMEGDVQDLKHVKVSGNDENREYTDFRMLTADMSEDSVRMAISQHIEEHPQSAVAHYLFQTHYVDITPADAKKAAEAQKLMKLLQDANPENPRIATYARELKQRDALGKGKKLPAFKLAVAAGDTITSQKCMGHNTLLLFWAGWQTGSTNMFYFIKKAQEEGRLQGMKVITYSMDLNSNSMEIGRRDGSDSWTYYCDYRGWDSPYVQKLGIHTLPYAILLDTRGRILASGTDYTRDIQPEIDRLP